MENLKVPYGLNSAGELVAAEHVSKGETYCCPGCGEQLIHRSGEFRAKHFAHPPASNCTIESVLHITAKRLIRNAINGNASNQKSISLRNHCQSCGAEFNTNLPPQTFSFSKEEVRVGEYVCDVAGYRDDEIALSIEILNTHEVDQKKAKNLAVHWIELKAEDVIANSYQWNPTQGRLKALYCKPCKDHIKHVRAVADKWGIDRSLYSPIKNPSAASYIADTETCFKCKKEIPVFWWRGVPFCETEPPDPKPKTIKYRNSKQYGGSYWANTCANCNMIQGDNYLFLFDSAPFKGMPVYGNPTGMQGAGVRVVSGESALSEFRKVINRNF